MKKNIVMSAVGVLLFTSLIANIFLLEEYVESSYQKDFQSRAIEDTNVLSYLIDRGISAAELKKQVQKLGAIIEVEELHNTKSQWDRHGPVYPRAIRAGNLTYYFDNNDRLVRIDHWLANNSPLYEVSR